MALRGTSKSGPGRILKHFHHFKTIQQMPFCIVAWQTLSTGISGRLGFYQSHLHGTDAKQRLSLGPLSLQTLSLNGHGFYKSCPVAPLLFEHICFLHVELYGSISPSAGMPEAQRVKSNFIGQHLSGQ